jgi:hypothetical protein
MLLLACATVARAGDTQAEFVPELNAFLGLSQDLRLFLLGDLTQNLSEPTTDGEVGVHLDITLKPILRRRLREADWERDRYLWIRLGFQLLGNLDDVDHGFSERRGVFEMTARLPLLSSTWLVSRSRVDLRDLDGEFSSRIRHRLGVEHELTLGGTALVPYAQAEVEIELTKHWRIEPYYARQEDQRSSPRHLDRFGFVLKTYW